MEVSLFNTDDNAHSLAGLTARRAGITTRELAPITDWSEMGESEHFVQFYEEDEALLNSLGGYIGMGLSLNDACIVVATKAHREALDKRLQEYGLDAFAARASMQYVPLDAAETLTMLMVDGFPDPGRFTEVIGGLVTRAASSGRRVRIFGEMVALLWEQGNTEATLYLEGLWNELSKTQPFMLFCAYSMNACGGEALADSVKDVCASHSRVIPAESYSGLASPDQRLRAIIQLQQKAVSLEAEIAKRQELLTREQMARAEAEAANRMKDEFLATVSHELRTPLNAILGWLYMLRRGGLDEAMAARALDTIERNAHSQAQLIEDILDVSRMITGKLRLKIAAVDLAAVINAAIDSLQLAASSKGIHLEVTLDPSARHLSGDAGRLQQVIWNLLSNAIKFTPPGGRVEVRLERASDHARVCVTDTGEGISKDFLPFIYDRFRQADGTSTRRHGGLGLGLAIVRHLVELHGGTVEADCPGLGCGATFIIKLPLTSALSVAKKSDVGVQGLWLVEAGDGMLKPLPSLEGVHVLLVDDDPDSLQMLTAMLSERHAKVQAARLAEEALEVLQWYRPHVLVFDLAMPSEDGYSLLGKVRALEAGGNAPTPAIALTAYTRAEDRARALSAGFNMFIAKPVEPSEMITAIANLSNAGANKPGRA
jgi:signal transduction histidine kinase/CheY-like chemotaxis protein